MNEWKLNGATAKWTDKSASLTFDQAKPCLELKAQGPGCLTQSTLSLFAIALGGNGKTTRTPPHVTCCGPALRVTFPESDAFPVETQITWRVLDFPKAVLALEAVISVVTQRLGAHPLIELRSHIPGTKETLPKGSGNEIASQSCSLFRLQDTDLSYVEMIHPADSHASQGSQDDEQESAVIRHALFSDPLEKGVVLRARLRAALLHQDDDKAVTQACFAQFLAAPPPLGR